MSRAYELRFFGLKPAQIRDKLVARLRRKGDLTSSEYADLGCDIGEFNKKNPALAIPQGPQADRTKGKA